MKIIKITEDENVLGNKVKQAIVIFDGEEYIVSDNGSETLIFIEDKNVFGGMYAVAGMFGLTLEYVLENFNKVLKAGNKEHFMSVFGFSK